MKVHLQRYCVVWFLLAYWSLSFMNEYFLRGHPLSAEAWQGMRLLALLVTASLAITLTRLLTTDASNRQKAAVAGNGLRSGSGGSLRCSIFLFFMR